jgi:5-hydroxyisourate hydrolase-like protein (transthyretin family)
MKARFTLLLIALLLITSLCLAQKNKKNVPPPQFCKLSFVVLRDSSGNPIKNASVVVHELKKDGTQESDGFQLKTDADGHAHMDDLTYGRYRVQAIVHGLQTFGDDFDVNRPEQEIVIRMKPPVGQISIY